VNLALTIFLRELATLPRQKRFYLKRASLVVLGSVILLWALGMESQSSGGMPAGLVIFSSLAMSTLFAVCLMSLMQSSALIMREKEERTLGLLFLSEISSVLFVVGKIATSMFSMVITIFSLLPLYMLAISLGGISAVQVVVAFAILLGVMFLGSCAGVFAATVTGSEKKLNGMLTWLALMLFVVLPIVTALTQFSFHGEEPSALVMSAISPFAAMANAVNGRHILGGVLDFAFCVLVGIPFALLSAVILPRKVISKEKPELAVRWRDRMKSSAIMRKWVIPDTITGNPVAWKDFHFWHGGARATWFKFGGSAIGVLLIVGLVGWKVGSRWSEIGQSLFITMCIFSFGVFALGSVSNAGMAFNRERKSRAMDILLTTSLSDREIVMGKIKAVALSLLPWIISSVVCFFALIFVYGWERGFWTGFTYVVMESVSMWFGMTSLALWTSLRYRKNMAFPVCVAVFMLWNTLGRGMMVSMVAMSGAHSMMDMMVVMDGVVFGVIGVWSLFNVFGRFREIALRDFDRG
jgi:ABC-type transport system involved in multi-copper enzyme maturation permease subunit